MRPEVTAGPMLRNFSPERLSSSFFSTLAGSAGFVFCATAEVNTMAAARIVKILFMDKLFPISRGKAERNATLTLYVVNSVLKLAHLHF
jgi:hypothetical protein